MADQSGSPQGAISWPELRVALTAAGEWAIGGFCLTFGTGILQNPQPEFKTLLMSAATFASGGFLLRVARIFGTNTMNGGTKP